MTRSTGGVKLNWPLVAIAFAVIGVPMGVAVIQDLGTDRDEDDLLAKIGEVDEISAAEPTGDDEARLERAEDLGGTWHEPAMDQAFFDELFLGGPDAPPRPALRGPLADIDWRMAPAVPPDLSRWRSARVELQSVSPPRLEAVNLEFPDDGTAERIFTNRWGDPLAVVGADQVTRKIWLDPGAHLRLVLEQTGKAARVSLAPYLPARDLINERGQFAFESYPLLGATSETLEANYGDSFVAGKIEGEMMYWLRFPGIETGHLEHGGVSVLLTLERNRVVAFIVTITHPFDADGGPNVFSALRTHLGPVVDQSSTESMNTWKFANSVVINQVVGSTSISVERSAR